MKTMLKRLEAMIKSIQTKRSPVLDLDRFNDAFVHEIEWTPLKRGGSSFQTHKLIEPEPFCLQFVASMGVYLFVGIFGLVGLALVSGAVVGPQLNKEDSLEFVWIIPLILGSVFSLIAWFMWRFLAQPKTFNTLRGFYWTGKKQPDPMLYLTHQKTAAINLSDIHGLQIIRELVRSKSSYFSFELNLVLNDKTRINVIDHGKLTAIQADAEKIAELINVPIWDATENMKS
ncbi:MAG: hypothetical protein L3J52_02300 [Proteobacteria bacterium]|nr:hypothetical protein [Pseudomonadota bacterium]